MKTWKTWTVKEIRQLEAMRLEGFTVEQAAKALGRSMASVQSKIKRSQDFPLISRTIANYFALVTVEHTNVGVAKILGVTPQAVKKAKQYMRKRGFDILPGSGSRWSKRTSQSVSSLDNPDQLG